MMLSFNLSAGIDNSNINVACLIPAKHMKAEWFGFNNHEAHAKIRDDSRGWSVNIKTNKLVLSKDIISRVLRDNTKQTYAYPELGCLKCIYHTLYSDMNFWACS